MPPLTVLLFFLVRGVDGSGLLALFLVFCWEWSGVEWSGVEWISSCGCDHHARTIIVRVIKVRMVPHGGQ
jgi:hypothetical protein